VKYVLVDNGQPDGRLYNILPCVGKSYTGVRKIKINIYPLFKLKKCQNFYQKSLDWLISKLRLIVIAPYKL